MPLDVQRHAVGRLIPPRPVLLQALHHDPVQIGRELKVESGELSRRHFKIGSLTQPGRRPHGFPFPDDLAHLIQSGLQQLLRVEGRAARQQLVEQHPQAVDVAARVDVQPAHLRLLRTHVGRRPDELLELRIDRLLGQLLLRRLGNAEVDHLRHRHPVVQRHQDVRGLDVPVDDPLLVRVLNGVADLDEQIQPLRACPASPGRSSR